MPRYQPNGATVASPRAGDFSASMRDAARRILGAAPHLTAAERQLLHDVQRRDGRSYFATTGAMLALSARCECPSVRYAVPESCRGQVLAASETPFLSVMEAFQHETAWQGRGDSAQLKHVDRRAAGTCDEAIAALTGHFEALRVAIDALHIDRARLSEWR